MAAVGVHDLALREGGRIQRVFVYESGGSGAYAAATGDGAGPVIIGGLALTGIDEADTLDLHMR